MPLANHPVSVAILWVLHEPFYPENGGVYREPWARLHAVENDLWMAQMLAHHRKIKVTVDLSPGAICQIDAYARGATDRSLELSGISAALLSAPEKHKIRQTFFAVSPQQLAALPRYGELARKPVGHYTVQDWRDLQTLFNLAWLSPTDRHAPAMTALIRKGRDFTENDKRRVLALQQAVLARILPTFARLERDDQIEIATEPYAQPVLPLLIRGISPGHDARTTAWPTVVPDPSDAQDQIREGIATYRHWLGHDPAGMWPAGGLVTRDSLNLLSKAGLRWVAAFPPAEPKAPWSSGFWLTGQGSLLAICDPTITKRFESLYPSWPGTRAAGDLLDRLRALGRTSDPLGPRTIVLALDAQRHWDSYPDHGVAFLDALYTRLEHTTGIHTVTLSEALRDEPHPGLPAGWWRASDADSRFTMWVGRLAQNHAWTALGAARAAVRRFATAHPLDADAGLAKDLLLQAEGSDWFAALGGEATAGVASAVDDDFRDLLRKAYRTIGEEPAEDTRQPLVERSRLIKDDTISPVLTGQGGRDWSAAQVLKATPDEARAPHGIRRVEIGHDLEGLYLAVDFNGAPRPVSFALAVPRFGGGLHWHGVPFGVQFLLELTPGKPGRWQIMDRPPEVHDLRAHWGPSRLEIEIPWPELGVRGGEAVLGEPLVLGARPLTAAPFHDRVPALPNRAVVTFSTRHPNAPVTKFSLEDDHSDWTFVWHLAQLSPAPYPGATVSLPILDAYLARGAATGSAVPLLPGRNAYAASAWTAAMTVDQDAPGLYRPNGGRAVEARVVVDPVSHTVSASIPRDLLVGNPQQWRYLVGSLSRHAGKRSAFRPLIQEAVAATGNPPLPLLSHRMIWKFSPAPGPDEASSRPGRGSLAKSLLGNERRSPGALHLVPRIKPADRRSNEPSSSRSRRTTD